MNKNELRQIYKKKRTSLSSVEKYCLDVQLTDHIINYILESKVRGLHCFLPIEKQKEYDSFMLISDVSVKDLNVFVPVVKEEEMIMVKYDPNNLSISSLGIPEPKGEQILSYSNVDLILVPLLVSDNKGNRVGYGKGFYDRFLSSVPTGIMKIGVSYFDSLKGDIPIDEWDKPLDGLFTPKGLVKF